MTPKVLAYHQEGPRVPLVVRVPQVGNHCTRQNDENIALHKIKTKFDYL